MEAIVILIGFVVLNDANCGDHSYELQSNLKRNGDF